MAALRSFELRTSQGKAVAVPQQHPGRTRPAWAGCTKATLVPQQHPGRARRAWAGCTKPELVPDNWDPLSQFDTEGVPIHRDALFILAMAGQTEKAFTAETQRTAEVKAPGQPHNSRDPRAGEDFAKLDVFLVLQMQHGSRM